MKTRREFLKLGLTAAAAVTVGTVLSPRTVTSMPEESDNFRLLVVGYDGLRADYAQSMWDQGAPGLNQCLRPITLTCGGETSTQTGWAQTWSGMDAHKIGVYSNREFSQIPANYHLVPKLRSFFGNDLFLGWITAKGVLTGGMTPDYPHWPVFQDLSHSQNPGVYVEKSMSNKRVFNLAKQAVNESLSAALPHFLIFAHFKDPDHTGHLEAGSPGDFNQYMEAAWEVDDYVGRLISNQCPPDTKVIILSDHGFDFVSQGDPRDTHHHSPHAFISTNYYDFGSRENVVQHTAARLIYATAGGDPDSVVSSWEYNHRLLGDTL